MALYPIELRRSWDRGVLCVVRQQREARMPGFSLDISQVFGGCLGEPGGLDLRSFYRWAVLSFLSFRIGRTAPATRKSDKV